MHIFKYLIFIFIYFLSHQSFASCSQYADTFVALMVSPGSVGTKHCVEFNKNKCEIIMESGLLITQHGRLPYGIFNGHSCQFEKEDYSCEDDVCPATEQTTCPETHQKGMYNGQLSCVRINDNVLECNTDYCFNPDNKFCPTGYVRGSFNEQAACVKSSTSNPNPNPDPDPDPDPDPNDDAESSLIKQTLTNIKTSIDTLNQTVSNSFTELTDLLTSQFENENNGDDENNNPVSVDTSTLEAEVPTQNYGNSAQSLSTNLFASSAQCPADNTLSMNFMGKTVTYTFRYDAICNALSFLGYFILLIAYVLAARIVVQA